MKLNKSLMTPKNSLPDFFSASAPQIPKLTTQLSVPTGALKGSNYSIKQRRQADSTANHDYVFERAASSLSAPPLMDIMDTFFQTAQSMEEEIMLPSRLKDMPVEQPIFDNTIQPDTWHQVYLFIREMRTQLRSARPFADEEGQIASTEPPKKVTSVDEGVVLSAPDNIQFSCASSISSDEFERSSGSSISSSYDVIRDELKYHYYGLFRTLNNLTSLANNVTEKYREEYLA